MEDAAIAVSRGVSTTHRVENDQAVLAKCCGEKSLQILREDDDRAARRVVFSKGIVANAQAILVIFCAAN